MQSREKWCAALGWYEGRLGEVQKNAYEINIKNLMQPTLDCQQQQRNMNPGSGQGKQESYVTMCTVMPIFVTVMLALCNACWDLVLSRAAMLIKHVLCLVLPTDTTLCSPK